MVNYSNSDRRSHTCIVLQLCFFFLTTRGQLLLCKVRSVYQCMYVYACVSDPLITYVQGSWISMRRRTYNAGVQYCQYFASQRVCMDICNAMCVHSSGAGFLDRYAAMRRRMYNAGLQYGSFHACMFGNGTNAKNGWHASIRQGRGGVPCIHGIGALKRCNQLAQDLLEPLPILQLYVRTCTCRPAFYSTAWWFSRPCPSIDLLTFLVLDTQLSLYSVHLDTNYI